MVESRQLVEFVKKTPFAYPKEAIHLFLAGSHLHGARIPGKSDVDVMGIYIEPPIVALGLDPEKGIVHGTSDPNVKNTASDEDATLKTLREWARLACKGNPTVLAALFAPPELCDPSLKESVWNEYFAGNSAFLAKTHIESFRGYGKQQYERMRGERGKGKHGQQRPELVEKYGYDTKMAMHLIRLMFEGTQLMNEGIITYPRPEVDLLLSIRNGEIAQAEVEEMYLGLEEEMKASTIKSHLPEAVDREHISRIVSKAYLEHWKAHEWLR